MNHWSSLALSCLTILSILSPVPSARAASEGADPIVGQWHWEVNVNVDLKPNGSAHMSSPIPMEGKWSSLSRGSASRERKYVIAWNNGQWHDSFTLSADRQHISGQNQIGWPINGIRVGGGLVSTEPNAPSRTAKERNAPAAGDPTSPADTSQSLPAAKSMPAGVVARNAVLVKSDADSALGDVKVTFSNGNSEILTQGGKCSHPHVSASGDVGWDRPDKVTGDRYGRNADVLHLCLHDGSVKEFKPNALFIIEWGFANQDSEVVIKSMAHHGPSSFIKYQIATGKVTGKVESHNPDSDLPAWAKPLGD